MLIGFTEKACHPSSFNLHFHKNLQETLPEILRFIKTVYIQAGLPYIGAK
jgi:hypothetical protein